MRPLQSIRSAPLVRAGIGVLVFIAVLSGLAGKGICNGKNTHLIGCWQNKSQDDIGVALTVTADTAKLDFSSYMCEAAGKFIGSDANKSTYRIRAPFGESLQGKCQQFRDAQMILTRNRDGSLLMHIVKPENKTDENVTLMKKSCD